MDFSEELKAIREHLDSIEAKIKEARGETARGYYNGGYNNAGANGNFTVEQWNERISRDR